MIIAMTKAIWCLFYKIEQTFSFYIRDKYMSEFVVFCFTLFFIDNLITAVSVICEFHGACKITDFEKWVFLSAVIVFVKFAQSAVSLDAKGDFLLNRYFIAYFALADYMVQVY